MLQSLQHRLPDDLLAVIGRDLLDLPQPLPLPVETGFSLNPGGTYVAPAIDLEAVD